MLRCSRLCRLLQESDDVVHKSGTKGRGESRGDGAGADCHSSSACWTSSRRILELRKTDLLEYSLGSRALVDLAIGYGEEIQALSTGCAAL